MGLSVSPSGGGPTTLTGDVTGTGTGTVPATIANDAITTVKILNGNVTLPKVSDEALARLNFAVEL